MEYTEMGTVNFNFLVFVFSVSSMILNKKIPAGDQNIVNLSFLLPSKEVNNSPPLPFCEINIWLCESQLYLN